MTVDLKRIYRLRKLPVRLLDEGLDSTTMPEVKHEGFRQKIFLAPSSGKLLVTGTAGPVINQLYQQGRTCVGMSFVDHYTAKLQGETDRPPIGEVLLLYGVGNEPAKNSEYATRLIEGVIDYCNNHNVLLIIETHLSATNFTVKYGLKFDNKIVLQLKEGAIWM